MDKFLTSFAHHGLLVGISLCFFEASVQGTTLTAFRRDPTVLPLTLAISRDSRYGPWVNATGVLYQLDSNYTPKELFNIKQAMDQLAADMSGCVRFQPYVPSLHAGLDHIYIGKTLNNGGAFPACFSFPGRVLDQAGHGQKIAIFGSSSDVGCADSVRDIMKYLAHALGLRNEINRPDRDRYVQIFNSNVRPDLQPLSLFRKYTSNQVDYLNATFDFKSITISSPQKHAIPGTVATSVLNSIAKPFGNLPRLSLGDCIGIALQYTGCSYATCRDPYSESATAPEKPTTVVQKSSSTSAPKTSSDSTTRSSTAATTTTEAVTTTEATTTTTASTTTTTVPKSTFTNDPPSTTTTPLTSTSTSTSTSTATTSPPTSTVLQTNEPLTTSAVTLTSTGLGSTSMATSTVTDEIFQTVPQDWEMPETFENVTGGPLEPSFSMTL